MERVVYDQLVSYLDKHHIIYEFQSGFRKSYSTDTALTYLTDNLRSNMDKGLLTGVLLIDLQKAFDTVNHSILKQKLETIGLDCPALAWFDSYLTNRQQFVDINGLHSKSQGISDGVPQGSILGPLLFTVYVNDMRDSVTCDLLLYADDSALVHVCSGKDPKSIETRLSHELGNLSKWLEKNKLSLHLGKTECILYGSKTKLASVNKLDIVCNGIKITSSTCIKYLGINIDESLSFSEMGNKVVKKVNNKLKFLYRKKSFFGIKERKMVCSAFLQSNFDYACNAWYRGLNCAIKKRLQTAQNKIIRYVLNYSARTHIGFREFQKLGWLNVASRVDYLTLNLMYNIFKGEAPTYFSDFYHSNHGHQTRYNQSAFAIPRVKSQGKNSFRYCGIKLWNGLPLEIKTATTKSSFKKLCKQFLLSNLHTAENSDFI